MVKSTSDNIWCRISHKAAQRGLNFEVIAAVLMKHIKSMMPKVKSVEVVFITSSKEDVLQLYEINKYARENVRYIKELIWKDKGIDILACKPGGHCGLCDDKTACDDIKKLSAHMRKNRD